MFARAMLQTTALAISTLLLTACGTFHHTEQTYYVSSNGSDIQSRMKYGPARLSAQVVPSTRSSSVPMLYHSRVWGPPYAIRFHTNTDGSGCRRFFLYSIKLHSESEVYVDKNYDTPQLLETCATRPLNNQELLRYDIGNALKFEQGKRIVLQIKYSRPDTGMRTETLTGKGKEKTSRSSLWDAYMGI
jgi:hypothetical protein